MKSGHECGSSDIWLGYVSSVEECAKKCRNKLRCKYFVVGKNFFGEIKCYWEKTTSQSCPEGWQADSYDFYEINGK